MSLAVDHVSLIAEVCQEVGTRRSVSEHLFTQTAHTCGLQTLDA
jgi:hypothetical protein